MRHYFVVVLVVLIFGAPWISLNYPDQVQAVSVAFQRVALQVATQFAAVILHNPRTVAELQAKYDATLNANGGTTPSGSTILTVYIPATSQNQATGSTTAALSTIQVLIVPGHEPDYGGTIFKNLNERDMNVQLGKYLRDFIQRDPHYSVTMTRDMYSWSSEFANYFKDNWQAIKDWQKASHDEVSHLIAVGSMQKVVPKVYHNTISPDPAYRLYGITKWANEHKIDITIHIHFNDYPDHAENVPGQHSGVSIYVPVAQFGNSTTTRAIAESVLKHLSKYDPISDLKGESSGIVDEQQLIAIGANNTADSASLLIEYGYIYEPQFTNPATRDTAIKDLAYQTYLGLNDFFGEKDPSAKNFDTTILPYTWANQIGSSQAARNSDPLGVFALQTAMITDGDYPPAGTKMNDCPRSGTFGACTKKALAQFQAKYGVTGEKDIVGPKTLEVLNREFGIQAN